MVPNSSSDDLAITAGNPFDELLDGDLAVRVKERVADLLRADALLKAVRLAAEVPQRQVAASLGVSASSVAQLEGRDINTVQVGTLIRYFQALGFELLLDVRPIQSAAA